MIGVAALAAATRWPQFSLGKEDLIENRTVFGQGGRLTAPEVIRFCTRATPTDPQVEDMGCTR